MATLTREYVTIDDYRLEYAWLGPPAREAPTIVFLHEGLGSITQWRDFPATLCARLGWGGLLYNRRGYGGSDGVGPLGPRFMHREALDVLPRLLETFRISRPVLFGHSDGGSIALIYAGAESSVSAGLILEAPHVFVEDVTVERIAEVRDAYRSSGLRDRLARHHRSNVDILFNSWTETWLSDEFRRWNIEDSLPTITCPTLVIQGADDEYGTLAQVNAITAGLSGPAETLVLDACRHSPHVDQRVRVEAVTVRFLRQLRVQP